MLAPTSSPQVPGPAQPAHPLDQTTNNETSTHDSSFLEVSTMHHRTHNQAACWQLLLQSRVFWQPLAMCLVSDKVTVLL
jgi:hypothetical protein